MVDNEAGVMNVEVPVFANIVDKEADVKYAALPVSVNMVDS